MMLNFTFLFVFSSQSKQDIAPPQHVVERYIELLCRFEPEQAYTFLKSNDNYRLEEALEVCRTRIATVVGFLIILFHRVGMYQGSTGGCFGVPSRKMWRYPRSF